MKLLLSKLNLWSLKNNDGLSGKIEKTILIKFKSGLSMKYKPGMIKIKYIKFTIIEFMKLPLSFPKYWEIL